VRRSALSFPPVRTQLAQHTMSRRRKHAGNYTPQVGSESLSSDDSALIGRPAKARKSNVYDAVAGKQVANPSIKT
jgi:hypothetical protein